VYANSPSGKLLHEGTLEAGGSLRFGVERVYRRYFIRVGRPGNLRMTVNGRVRELPSRGPVYVTARRVTAATGTT
jgi:RodZ C-terminal domain